MTTPLLAKVAVENAAAEKDGRHSIVSSVASVAQPLHSTTSSSSSTLTSTNSNSMNSNEDHASRLQVIGSRFLIAVFVLDYGAVGVGRIMHLDVLDMAAVLPGMSLVMMDMIMTTLESIAELFGTTITPFVYRTMYPNGKCSYYLLFLFVCCCCIVYCCLVYLVTFNFFLFAAAALPVLIFLYLSFVFSFSPFIISLSRSVPNMHIIIIIIIININHNNNNNNNIHKKY